MAYPRRRLGDADPSCADPNYAAFFPEYCGGVTDPRSPTSVSSGGSFLDTVLTDVMQFFKPGTPSTRPLFTPQSQTTQLLSNPLVVAGLAFVVYKIATSRR